ncbi:MAG: hypothetical protein M3Q10_19850, partial [Chloroflexota bacterium]|nr:hypothetical protein [Chloroflexota bacterium]
MQREADAKTTTAPPGIFETIALAVSALLVQPLPLALPIVVDAALWAGPRLSPASVVDPVGRWLADRNVEGQESWSEPLAALSGSGDVAAIVGFFVPSILGFVDTAAPWSPASVVPGAGATLALVPVLFLVGLWGGMLFSTMLARIVRGGSPLAGGWLRAATVAALRYLGFWALVVLAVGLLLVPTALAVAISAVVGLDGLLLAVLVPVALVAFLGLLFVRDAIAVAAVGPLRACALSVGVARRHPWPTIGLLAVTLVGAGGLGNLADRI